MPTAVDDYVADAPEERRAALVRLRDECRARLAGFDEGLQYRMPTYSRAGTPEFAFASQARYVSLYVMRGDVVQAHSERLAGLDMGKSCLRFTSPDRIDWDLVASLLDATSAARLPAD